MEEVDSELRPDVMTALVAAVTDQKESLKDVRDQPPELSLSEAERLLEEDGISNEALYLRDAGLLGTGSSEKTVTLVLNPDIAPEAAKVRDLYRERYSSFAELAEAEEYMKFEAPDGWPIWEGPEKNEKVNGTVSYEEHLGSLCAVLSVYGEERIENDEVAEYTIETIEEEVSLEGYEPDFDVKQNLEILEQLGYIEKYRTEQKDVYRLADNEAVKSDAEKITEFRDEIYSEIPQNMAVAFEKADQVEMQQKGVNLVQRPGTQAQ